MDTSSAPCDFAWFRDQLLGELLPRWLALAPTPEGLFLPHLDRQWRPTGESFGTLVSQGRLLANFAIGFELTREPDYEQAVRAGARFLLDTFRDPDHGGWFYAVDRDGSVVDDRKDSYGHAFVLFGLSHAARVTGDPAMASGAVDALNVLNTRFADPHGGLVSRMTREFADLDTRRSQNPVMHGFEARLALADVPGHASRLAEAERVARFVFPDLLAPDGALPELFTMDWQPLPADQGGWTNIGHQFEWAFLLSSAVERGLPTDYLHHAHTLLDRGMALGYDPTHSGIYGAATPDGHLRSTRKGWWEQCEAIRTMLHFAVLRGRDDLWEPLQQTLAFVQKAFVDPQHGGWFPQTEADGTPVSTHKGSPFKLDYHQAGMCTEALRLEALDGRARR